MEWITRAKSTTIYITNFMTVKNRLRGVECLWWAHYNPWVHSRLHCRHKR